MKITKLLLIGLTVVLFSCGKDDDPKPSNNLAGTWKITSLDYHGTSTTTAQGMSFEATFTGTGKDMNMTTTFSSNPNKVINEGNYTIVLTTTMLGQSVTQEYTFDEAVTEGTWAVNGNKLIITTSIGPQEATIIEQTATTLKLKIDVTESETQQGVTVSTEIEGSYTFTKQ